MSAGVCGKRVGIDEIYRCSSAAKRPRCSASGSANPPKDLESGSEDSLLFLLQMFPSLNRELVETVLETHNGKIEDAIESLRVTSFGNCCLRTESQGQATTANCAAPPETGGQIPEEKLGRESALTSGCQMEGPKWVDVFVREILNARDIDDARDRAAMMLEAFESRIIADSKASQEVEHALLRERLESLLKYNQILKRAVAIQHDRNLEQEEKAMEVQQLKHVINQYHEQLRTLELTNYTLKLHLQRAQEKSSIPGRFHPHVF